ncbi:MAG: AzlC family ABC transporter permease [Pseudomonadota bacterium]
MTTTSRKRTFWRGMVDGSPFLIVLAPFGALFGVVATEAGLPVFQTLAFSVVVIAGAAQFTALSLLEQEAPTIIVIATALAVNMRMAMYSAALTPYLGAAPLWQRSLIAYLTVDQSFAVCAVTFERDQTMTLAERVTYFLGVVAPVVPLWYGCTLLGALLGENLPPWFALDFALPITFIAMIAPALTTPAHIAAATTAVVASLLLVWMPFSSGIIVAGLLGMAVGAEVERRTQKAAP